ncbi:hypothetical protein AB395_00003769 [Sinorhizobium fredii CCBAU 45436]|nr:hypothetical protein AB395_00003769 [Sinorhizobium fredii CCBAU 45436]AWM27079.1 hypothetical protein AOX55_00003849 [Sinorhizobium fredii CCBAU 25509]
MRGFSARIPRLNSSIFSNLETILRILAELTRNELMGDCPRA